MKTSERKRRWHSTVLRVPLFEVDLGKAVYHGNYFHFFEAGRDDFFRAVGFPYAQIMGEERHLTIAELRCRYLKPLHYDQIIRVETGVEEIRSRSLSMRQRILAEKGHGDPMLCTEALFIMVCVDFVGKPRRLPEALRCCLETWIVDHGFSEALSKS